MANLVFLVATYNEENEIVDLLNSVMNLADYFVISDDGSTDNTLKLANTWSKENNKEIYVIKSEHSGLPETVKKFGVQAIEEEMGPDTWVLMLDADERFPPEVKKDINLFINSEYSKNFTHIWFNLLETVGDQKPRVWLKCRLFRAGYVHFSEAIHVSEQFTGKDANFEWVVLHRKTEEKQRLREKEYIQTYKKLQKEGKLSEDWIRTTLQYHYFIREVD